MGKPHKHAEVIKAWADGADIQMRVNGSRGSWTDVEDQGKVHLWYQELEYRVKPENIIKDMVVYYGDFTANIKVPLYRKANVRYTFSPEGELVNVEKL